MSIASILLVVINATRWEKEKMFMNYKNKLVFCTTAKSSLKVKLKKKNFEKNKS